MIISAANLCVVLLLVTSCHVITTLTLSDGVKVMRSERWLYPCAGSTAAEVVDNDVITLSVPSEEVERKTRRNESIDWNGTLKVLTEKTNKLRKRVEIVKQLYVRDH